LIFIAEKPQSTNNLDPVAIAEAEILSTPYDQGREIPAFVGGERDISFTSPLLSRSEGLSTSPDGRRHIPIIFRRGDSALGTAVRHTAEIGSSRFL
jgi:hypothetical protein